MPSAFDIDLVQSVLHASDPLTLRVVEAVARAKRENARLRDERDWLERRIAEEDARLAHA